APRPGRMGLAAPLARRRALPRPAPAAPVRRLAPGQPAAPSGQEHHGLLAGAALPLPRPPPDRARLPPADARQGARAPRQVARARARPPVATGRKRAAQQEPLLPSPRIPTPV